MRTLLVLLVLFVVSRLEATIANQVRALVGMELTNSLPIVAKIKDLDEKGRNALHHAAMFGDLALVEFLTSNGATTKTHDVDGLLPLDYAIREAETSKTSEQMLIVSHILEMTWGVNGRDEKGWLPINWAILAGDLRRVSELIDKGTESRFLYNLRTDPFNLAMLINNDELIKLLVSVWGVDIIWAAVVDDDLTKFKKILEELEGKVNITDKHGETPLHKVALYGAKKFAELLLDAGAELNATNDFGETPLAALIYNGAQQERKAIAELLIRAGARVDATDCHGQTPLHIASKYGYLEFAKLLLEAGAMVNAINCHGRTPLHETSRYGYLEIAKLLLEAGAMINALDKNGQTPLHIAANKGMTEIVELYLNAGAETTIIDSFGKSPLDYARKYLHVAELFPRVSHLARDML